ncbi:AbrB/MazE/SpoVT family DNA-binding domain-containing protein [Streptomonospora nanhaiensis]|nr:AbrB/MazE/SpoVT family DNA-binding domain-containing protein [Streptomonospora nanhaiensis]MBX9391316.1 AbrB/MazE/SpoVT family DNA-binding domain-containing protein [Streptomonospora nanhaiensis]
MRRRNQLTVPAEIVEALHIREGDEVEFTVDANGDVHLRGLMVVPADQRWYWTDDWQRGEREASEQIEAGEGAVYDHVDAMFDDLDR